MDFDALVNQFEQAWIDRYKRPVARSQVYWDAIRYDLYGVLPCYIEESDDGLKRLTEYAPVLREE
jgi:hypothetical protein